MFTELIVDDFDHRWDLMGSSLVVLTMMTKNIDYSPRGWRWYGEVVIAWDHLLIYFLVCCIIFIKHLADIAMTSTVLISQSWYVRMTYRTFSQSHISIKIKTHGSVSCGPRSRRATPWVYWQEERKRNFRTSVALCCLDETRQILLCTFPPTSVLHIPNLREIASGIPEICDFKNWLSFFVFFSSYFSSSFRTLTKTAIKRERVIRLPWNLAHRRGV